MWNYSPFVGPAVGLVLAGMAGIIAAQPAAAPRLLSPGEAAQFAADDILTVPPQDRCHVRYLSVHDFPAADRVDAYRVLNEHVHSLSTEQAIAPLVVVAASDYSVFRLDLRNYHWPRSLWEKLGTFDTFFHDPAQAAKIVPVRRKRKTKYVDPPGINYTLVHGEWQETYVRDLSVEGGWRRVVDEYEEVIGTVQEPTLALAAHLSAPPGVNDPASKAALAKKIGMLCEQTNSAAPILMGDWFFRMTATQEEDRFPDQKPPGYYDFLGLGKKQADFEELIGADLDLARFQFKDEAFATVARSTVTHNNRRLLRFGKVGGAWWATLDGRASIGKRNFLRNPDDLDVANNGFHNTTGKHGFAQIAASRVVDWDATEQFGTLPNHLMAWWLANRDGQRQSVAPDFIAKDSTAPGTDDRVRINVSCVRCHKDGIKPFGDWARDVLRPPLQNNIKDFDAALRQKQLYLSDISESVTADQLLYQRAVYRTTSTPAVGGGVNCDGLTTQRFNTIYTALWKRYDVDDWTIDRISLLTGYDKDHVMGTLRHIAQATGNVDPVLAGVVRGLLPGEQARPIRSDQLEEVFPLLMMNLHGYVPTPGNGG